MLTSKRKMCLELSINGLLLITPIFLIIDGNVGLADNDPYHPDVFILIGLLILGLLGLAMTGLTIIRMRTHGWHSLALYQKALSIFYFICLIIGGICWLIFTEAIPPNWIFH
ncbi:hypothetical protein [Secundilactobacillus collinoides]|uniref:Integral membrane protein n=1 Tax=Secundilactobacillus collinoides TaxID=33960 RepID=A0A166GAJ9_SECCO|nr:hypothetical protein [Secundilactobacillus collinoides]KZL37736.1 hypothetical protein TY91_12415 [Secundilactobacillus collinoides]